MVARTLVLALLAALTPGADRAAEPAVVDGIAAAAETPLEASELTVYAWHESQARERPVPRSWDARAGVSCGPWQLRCALSSTPAEDARIWLSLVRLHGLVAVDGSRSRAAIREAEARRISGVVDGIVGGRAPRP